MVKITSHCFVHRASGGSIDSTWCTAYHVDAIMRLSRKTAPTKPDFEELVIHRRGEISIYLTPFDDVMPDARVVLVGTTPGWQQLKNGVVAAGRALLQGSTVDKAITEAKVEGAFSGPLRGTLVRMLDGVGLSDALGIKSCSEFFEPGCRLASSTSAICHATFRGAENYSKTPKLATVPILREFARAF
jgi:hypothetical protein